MAMPNYFPDYTQSPDLSPEQKRLIAMMQGNPDAGGLPNTPNGLQQQIPNSPMAQQSPQQSPQQPMPPMNPMNPMAQESPNAQIGAKGTAALEKASKRRDPAMDKYLENRASDPWTALAQIGGAAWMGKKNRANNAKTTSALQKSLQKEANRDEKDRTRLLKERTEDRLTAKEKAALETRNVNSQIRDRDRVDESWSDAGDYVDKDGKPFQRLINSKDGSTRKEYGTPFDDDATYGADGGRTGSKSDFKPTFGGRGTYENKATGEQVEGVFENGILTSNGQQLDAAEWLSDGKAEKSYDIGKTYFGNEGQPKNVFRDEENNSFEQYEKDDGSIGYAPFNSLGFSDKPPEKMTASELKIHNSDKLKRQGQDKLSNALSNMNDVFMEYNEKGYGIENDPQGVEGFGKNLLNNMRAELPLDQFAKTNAGNMQDSYVKMKDGVIGAFAAAAGLGSKQFDSTKEGETIRNAMGDLNSSPETQLAVIENLYETYASKNGIDAVKPPWLVEMRENNGGDKPKLKTAQEEIANNPLAEIDAEEAAIDAQIAKLEEEERRSRGGL